MERILVVEIRDDTRSRFNYHVGRARNIGGGGEEKRRETSGVPAE